MRFSLHFHEFLTILSLPIFSSKISADISVKLKYRYIRDYRYFHPWEEDKLTLKGSIIDAETFIEILLISL